MPEGGAAPGGVGVFGCQGVGRPCVCMRVCVCLFVVARGDRSRPLVIAGPGGIPPHFLGWRRLPCPGGLGVLGAWDLWLGCPAASPGGLGVGPLLPLGLGCPGAFPLGLSGTWGLVAAAPSLPPARPPARPPPRHTTLQNSQASSQTNPTPPKRSLPKIQMNPKPPKRSLPKIQMHFGPNLIF